MPMRMPMSMPREPSETAKAASASAPATLHLCEHLGEIHVHATAHHIIHAWAVVGAVFVSAEVVSGRDE